MKLFAAVLLYLLSALAQAETCTPPAEILGTNYTHCTTEEGQGKWYDKFSSDLKIKKIVMSGHTDRFRWRFFSAYDSGTTITIPAHSETTVKDPLCVAQAGEGDTSHCRDFTVPATPESTEPTFLYCSGISTDGATEMNCEAFDPLPDRAKWFVASNPDGCRHSPAIMQLTATVTLGNNTTRTILYRATDDDSSIFDGAFLKDPC